ncbi:MAG: riboflavin synthase [Bacteroidota bacterium]
MFTGIIEALGEVVGIEKEGTNVNFELTSPIGEELHIDQSLSHNGVCLTVTKVQGGSHWVTAVDETLQKSNLGRLGPGDLVNLERSMPSHGRFDGHIVQGHVDLTGTVTGIKEEDGSWLFDFSYPPGEDIVVEKGSVCVNGVSLTCFNATDDSFRVAIIPYTYEHTNFKRLKVGDTINLEFDVIGKYVSRLLERREIGL